jgi:hypothetical protein
MHRLSERFREVLHYALYTLDPTRFDRLDRGICEHEGG